MPRSPAYDLCGGKNPIIVGKLLTMAGGLDYNFYAPGIGAAIKKGKAATRELVEAMAQTVWGFESGTHFHYSLCYDVLGARMRYTRI